MLKATKLSLAAAFLAGSCGLAMAQGTSGAGGGADPNPTAPGINNNTSGGTIKPAKPMTQKNTGMPTATKERGQETGTAKDSASTGAMRDESK